MEKLTNNFIDLKWYYQFIILLPIMFTFVTIFNYLVNANPTELNIWLTLTMTFAFSFIPVAFIYLGKDLDKFYTECNRIETRIKNNEDKDSVYADLVKISKEGFHQSQYSRKRELYKMFEIKYDCKITK